ncbi:MAG: hypothetical protein WBO46_02695 [Caldilineaceae bacterium]
MERTTTASPSTEISPRRFPLYLLGGLVVLLVLGWIVWRGLRPAMHAAPISSIPGNFRAI